jgi:hypothetical protein
MAITQGSTAILKHEGRFMKTARRLLAAMFVLTLVVLPRVAAQTQEVIYNNHLPVYVGDLIDENEATVQSGNAGKLCARLNRAIKNLSESELAQHDKSCIFEIVRFSDLSSEQGPKPQPEEKLVRLFKQSILVTRGPPAEQTAIWRSPRQFLLHSGESHLRFRQHQECGSCERRRYHYGR